MSIEQVTLNADTAVIDSTYAILACANDLIFGIMSSIVGNDISNSLNGNKLNAEICSNLTTSLMNEIVFKELK